jgi:hypothetical protein
MGLHARPFLGAFASALLVKIDETAKNQFCEARGDQDNDVTASIRDVSERR